MKARLFGAVLLAVALTASAFGIGRVYGLKSRSIGGGGLNETQPPVHLFSFAPDGSSFYDHGVVREFGYEIMVDGLAFSPRFGLIGFTYLGGAGWFGCEMVNINTQTCAATPGAGFLPERDIRGAAFDPFDRLWGLCYAKQKLVRLDPVSGEVLEDITMTLDGQPVSFNDGVDIAFDNDRSYVSLGNQVFSVDLATGVLTLLHTANATENFLVGLAFAPEMPNRLLAFDVNAADDLLWFDLADNFSRHVLLGNILSFYNAGRGDLAALPESGLPIIGRAKLLDLPTAVPSPMVKARLYQGTTLVAEWPYVPTAPDGTFTVYAPAPGEYSLTVKAWHWLGKSTGPFQVGAGGASGPVVDLPNGDIDDDNAVTVFDYNVLSEAFDTVDSDWSFDPRADLDADGAITVFDYNILSNNFDLVGDE